jgi:SAM-dependent methyltransferase
LPAGSFDVIFSAGLIEHFDDPISVLHGIAGALRPTGVLITLVPNLTGWWGVIQRHVDPEILAIHKVYGEAALDRIHIDAGLVAVEPAHYFGGFCPLIVNYMRRAESWPAVIRTGVTLTAWVLQQAIAWTLPLFNARDSAQYSGHVLGVYSIAGARPATIGEKLARTPSKK